MKDRGVLARKRPVIIWLLTAFLLGSIGTPAPAARAANNQWSKLDLNGVEVRALEVDPTNASRIFAGSAGQGVFVTENGGQSWQATNNGLGNLFVNRISVDPNDPDHVLAATGRGPAVGEPTAGIYRLTRSVATWQATLPNAAMADLARAPQNPSVVYAAGAGIFKSTNSGVSWSRIGAGSPALANIDLSGISPSPADPNLVYAVGNTEGGSGRIVRSTDAGTTWSILGDGLPALTTVTTLRSGSTVLVGSLNGVFRSIDGLNFQQITAGLGNTPVFRFLVNPITPEVYAGTQGRGVWRSLDGGASWTQMDSSLAVATVRGLAANTQSPQTIYAGTADGVFGFTIVQPPAASTWFFAEGSTQAPFETWFLVQNPTDTAATVRFTFQRQGGGEAQSTVSVGPHSRFSLFANPILPNAAFSTRIESAQQIFVERSMYVSYDGHVVTGIPGPSTTWFFAEGSTQVPFQTWLLLQNPNSQATTARITYLMVSGASATQTISLPPTSRTSIFVNQVLPNQAFSSRVDSDAPIVAERAMYRFPGNAATGVSGVTTPSQTWYFAHGDTTGGSHTWLLLLNPNSTSTTVRVTLLDEQGAATQLSATLPPTSRQSLFINQTLTNHRFGAIVEANQPIVAEKSLFFGTEPRGAAATQGASALDTLWLLPEGSTAAPFDEVISILNPNQQTMNAHIDFEMPDGQVIGRDFTIGARRNQFIQVDTLLPNAAISARVTTNVGAVVERTMFIHKLGSLGGHNTIGISGSQPSGH